MADRGQGGSSVSDELVFAADTAVVPISDHCYDASLTDRWNALGGTPNGGYMLAVCLRALSFELDRPDPLVASAYFLRPGRHGPAQVHTDTVRTGRRVSTGQARLVQGPAEVVRVVASYGDLAISGGRTRVRALPPVLPDPDQCTDMTGGRQLAGVTIIDRVEYRSVRAPGWTGGEPSGDSDFEFWMRLRDAGDTDVFTLAMLVDAAAPAVLELGEVGSSTVELTVHIRARPAPGWLACRVSTRYLINGLHEEDFEIWDSRGNLVAQSRQLGIVPTG